VIKISSRQSALAKIQAYQVGQALQFGTGNKVEFHFRESLGDKNLLDPLWKMPEKGVFTEDFYLDLITNQTDMVVHSWKDLPTEIKPETKIAATLNRQDQRDVLLYKKSSLKNPQVRLYSSSPRRALNVKNFLPWALPWSIAEIEFFPVRGNIQTRIQKLLDDPKIDGLILAKAALDRLLSDSHFAEVHDFLRKSLEGLQWMVLPLSENPNAAAQGALAIEVANSNFQVNQLLEKINCLNSFATAQRERDILKKFGGGCHLALGVAVLQRDYGQIEIIKGLTPEGKIINDKKFFPKKVLRLDSTPGKISFTTHRIPLPVTKISTDAIFVSKSAAWSNELLSFDSQIVWSAGLQTWKKLAELGVWVHGSSEGLGEHEDPRIDLICGKTVSWTKVSHDSANMQGSTLQKNQLGTYHLELTIRDDQLSDHQAWSWASASEFYAAVAKFPELKNRKHVCGPGNTYSAIKQFLGSDQNIFVELGHEFITVI
jgi:hydroxymethylbilane synthase